MQAPTNGPVVAVGTLVDADGLPAAGTVAVTAWPDETFNRTLGIGSQVVTPTVGWARAGSDGSFTLRVDPRLLGADYVSPDGVVNLVAIGWTQTSQGSWAFPATVGFTMASFTSSTSSSPTAAARFTITAKDRRTSAGDLTSSSATLTGNVVPLASCSWLLQSSYDAMTVIGQTWPYGLDTGWMSSDTSHSMTVGVAASTSGTYGSWSANGTSITSSGVTFTWAESTAYRNYQVQLRYGKYRLACGGLLMNSYSEMVQYPTGGFTTASISGSSLSQCVPVSMGVWQRVQSNGNHFTLAGGVLIAPLLGINLSVDTDYATSHILYYRLTADGKVCGDNNVPSLASNVNTSR